MHLHLNLVFKDTQYSECVGDREREVGGGSKRVAKGLKNGSDAQI